MLYINDAVFVEFKGLIKSFTNTYCKLDIVQYYDGVVYKCYFNLYHRSNVVLKTIQSLFENNKVKSCTLITPEGTFKIDLSKVLNIRTRLEYTFGDDILSPKNRIKVTLILHMDAVEQISKL